MRALRLGVLLAIAAGLAALLVLRGGAEEEPTAADEVGVALLRAATTADRQSCREAVTLSFLEQRTGYEGDAALAECTERGIGGGFAESVSVRSVDIDGNRATVTAAIYGGYLDGATAVVSMVDDNGWRLDRIERLEGVERAEYIDAYLPELEGAPYRFDREEARCVAERSLPADAAQFEQQLIAPDPVRTAASMVACDRPTVERLLGDHLQRENLSARVRACVLAAAANAPDSRLARLYGDPSDLAGIWYGCGAS